MIQPTACSLSLPGPLVPCARQRGVMKGGWPGLVALLVLLGWLLVPSPFSLLLWWLWGVLCGRGGASVALAGGCLGAPCGGVSQGHC